jgi:hypothetical protein
MHSTTDFLASPKGVLAQHRRRRRSRIYLHIEDVEPEQKKSMTEAAKDKIQQAVVTYLEKYDRRAFTGPIALRISLQTTEKSPTHLHHIAKNLLDLFGRPRPSIKTKRRGLLYVDDRQVHALSVTCRHGEDRPGIHIFACPLNNLLTDLVLAVKWARENAHESDRFRPDDHHDGAVDEFLEMRREGKNLRQAVGDTGYKAMLQLSQQQAQESLLGHRSIRPDELAAMFDNSGRKLGCDLGAYVERVFASSPLRIRLSGLPQKPGTSDQWKKEIDAELRKFQQRYHTLIDPWLVPLALEVLVKPESRDDNLHDLDNVVRTYLIPKVVEILKPLSDFAFTFDPESIRETAPELYTKFGSLRRPPVSTKFGVCRYEAWRLRPADDDAGAFVSIAVVADNSGLEDSLGQIEDLIRAWREALEAAR